jgi:cytochrome c oxidase cbb3-type subunit 3
MRRERDILITGLLGLSLLITHIAAQGGAPQAPAPTGAPAGQGGRGGAGGQGGGRAATFPAQQRTLAAPDVIARGKIIYGINCASCHGPDARGGDQGGPNLLRSQLVLNDQHGELIIPIVQGSRQNAGMDAINMPDKDIADVAEFIHSLSAAGRGGTQPVVLNVLVGNATAGQAYFAAKCGPCHSVTGDLKGIATRIPDPKTLQNFWVSGGAGGGRGGGGGGAAPEAANPQVTMVTVTLASGPKVEGRLIRADDFSVSLVQADGSSRTFRRDGDVPKVEIHDPLEPHKKLLPVYTDKDIHDVTAFLVTLK